MFFVLFQVNDTAREVVAVTLPGLNPYSSYTIQVRVHVEHVSNKYWSDYSEISATTAADSKNSLYDNNAVIIWYFYFVVEKGQFHSLSIKAEMTVLAGAWL